MPTILSIGCKVNISMAKQERKFDRSGLVSYLAFGLVVMLLTYLIVAHTPIRRTIPGYPSLATRRAALENYRKIDSLEKAISLWAFQVANIQRAVTGREALPLDSLRLTQIQLEATPEDIARYEFSDSLLRSQVEQLDAEQAARPAPEKIEALRDVKFRQPLKGTVVDNRQQSEGRLNVEVTAPSGTTVAAILDGIIVSAEWNELEGCTIRMQHENDLTTIFRHAGKLLKSIGEPIKAGTPIATVGETGELSQAHIIVELRYKNQPLDAALYIPF